MSNATKITVGGTSYDIADSVARNNSIYYGTCATAAATAAKVATCPDLPENATLRTGMTVCIKFTYANSASNPTLNVNGSGAVNLYQYGTTAMSTTAGTTGWQAGAIVVLVYDGTGWVRNQGYNTNSTYAAYSFGIGYGTCATAETTVAKAVTFASYTLAKNGICAVKFTYAVPASATMNINSKGAKSIFYKGAAITAGIIKAGDLATFVYDGTNYQLMAVDRVQDTYTKSEIDTMIGDIESLLAAI